MNMESPKQGTEEMMYAFINKYPKLAEEKFSRDEIHQAAVLLDAKIAISSGSIDEDMIRQFLDARLNMRGVAEKIPVINNEDNVIGMADSIEEAKKMSREDNETRDLK